MELQCLRRAEWQTHSCRLAEKHAEVDAPFLKTVFWPVPPPYEPWLGNLVVNYSTSESKGFRFFRIPEPRVSLALLLGPDRAQFLVSGATLKLHAVPTFLESVVIGPIVLRPGAAQSLLGMPSSEVANQMIDAECIWGGWARELVERIAQEKTTERRISRFLELLHVRLTSAPDTTTEQIVALAAARHAAPVRELAAASGYSERQLRRIFLDHVGVGPKDFGRLTRVTLALRGLATAPSNWSRYAMAHGYYDQAHLIAEFRELVGQTPQRFLNSLVEPRLLEKHVAIQAIE